MDGYILIGICVIAAALCIRYRQFGLLTCLVGGAGWVGCMAMKVVYEVQYHGCWGPAGEDAFSQSADKMEALEPWILIFGIIFWIGAAWIVIDAIRWILRRRACRRQEETPESP